jgi:hypothetical protein
MSKSTQRWGTVGSRRSLLQIPMALALMTGLVATVAATSSGASTAPSAKWAPKGVLSFAQAKAEGKVKSINWGANCNTTLGLYKYPDVNAMECYAPFKGSNGGATATGVTATSIKVVVYLPEQNDPILSYIEGAIKDTATNAQTEATLQGWVGLFNHYAQLYGRTIDLVPFVATGISNDPVAAHADALTIATNIKPFAVLDGPAVETSSAFATELASQHILCINCSIKPNMSYYASHSPYQWSLGISGQQQLTHLMTYLSREVAGRKATFAGDASLRTKTRKFGVVVLGTETFTPSVLKQFKKAGVPIAQVVTYASPLDLVTSAPTLIAKLRSAGVTSIIFDGDPIAPQSLTRAAANQGYHPEWILSGSVLSDTAVFGRTYDQSEWSHAFGLSFGTARVAVDGLKALYQWYTGVNPPDLTSAVVPYAALALLVPILQGVGPDVTAQNFKNSAFAAPRAKEMITSAAYNFGMKGIWPYADYAGVDDATQVWWNATATGPDEIGRSGTGLYEYVAGGKRYLPSSWPKGATKAFKTAGAITIYPEPPPGERPPVYPPPS